MGRGGGEGGDGFAGIYSAEKGGDPGIRVPRLVIAGPMQRPEYSKHIAVGKDTVFRLFQNVTVCQAFSALVCNNTIHRLFDIRPCYGLWFLNPPAGLAPGSEQKPKGATRRETPRSRS